MNKQKNTILKIVLFKFNTKNYKKLRLVKKVCREKYYSEYKCHGSGMWVLKVLLVLVLDEGSVALNQVLWLKWRS